MNPGDAPVKGEARAPFTGHRSLENRSAESPSTVDRSGTDSAAPQGGAASDTEQAGSPLIRLRGITKIYGEGATAFHALRGVDLDVDRGDFVAIMGPSGSGKSTAMNLIGCLDRPSGGQYEFLGARVEALDRDQRARLRRRYFGFVFQGFNLLARTSAQENVELPLLYRGESRVERHRQAARALASVGLTGWEHHTPAELSGGQQQRVAIARAIVTEPAVLLADEPTGNLDTHRSREIMELLWRLNADRGITVLMVTHEPEMAAWARRIVHFVDGMVDSDRRNEQPTGLAADAQAAAAKASGLDPAALTTVTGPEMTGAAETADARMATEADESGADGAARRTDRAENA